MKELIYMKQHKQVKTMEMVLDLIFKMRDVYIHSNSTQPQNSVPVAEAPSLKISSHGASLKWSLR